MTGGNLPTKVYLGDGVYAAFNGWRIVLTTEGGGIVTNRIYLEPLVLNALDHFRKKLAAPQTQSPEGEN